MEDFSFLRRFGLHWEEVGNLKTGSLRYSNVRIEFETTDWQHPVMRFKCLSKQHGDAWKARLGALLAQVRGLLARRSASQNIQTNRTKLSARLYPPTRCAAVCASAHPAGMATQQTEQRRHDPLAETQGRLEDLCCRINPNEPQVGPRTALALRMGALEGLEGIVQALGVDLSGTFSMAELGEVEEIQIDLPSWATGDQADFLG